VRVYGGLGIRLSISKPLDGGVPDDRPEVRLQLGGWLEIKSGKGEANDLTTAIDDGVWRASQSQTGFTRRRLRLASSLAHHPHLASSFLHVHPTEALLLRRVGCSLFAGGGVCRSRPNGDLTDRFSAQPARHATEATALKARRPTNHLH
jgi:hypothetical protein